MTSPNTPENLINQLTKKNTFSLKSFGQSMYPTIHEGDIVTVKKIPLAKVKVNDIVFIKTKSQTFIHRIIYISQQHKNARNFIITKGDNSKKIDGRFTPIHLIGKVTKLKRRGLTIQPDTINLMQSTIYYGEIAKIRTLFEKKRINYVFLKGLPLHLYYEKVHPARMYADCDILIDPPDYIPAEKLLTLLGFKKSDTSFTRVHKLLKDKPTEVNFSKITHNFRVTIDVHLEPVFLMNQIGKLENLYSQELLHSLTKKFLGEKIFVNVHGKKYPLLAAENCLLYLLLHFFHHNCTGIYRLQFIANVLKYPNKFNKFNLNIFVQTVGDYKLANFIYPSLLYLSYYFPTDAVNSLLTNIQKQTNRHIDFKKLAKTDNVFINQNRFEEGITRFKLIFILSPNPLFYKLFVLVNPGILFNLIWVIYIKIKSTLLSFSSLSRLYTPQHHSKRA